MLDRLKRKFIFAVILIFGRYFVVRYIKQKSEQFQFNVSCTALQTGDLLVNRQINLDIRYPGLGMRQTTGEL